MAAGFKAYKSGAWRQATKVQLRRSGAWIEVLRIRLWRTVNNQSGWRDVYVKSGTTPTPSPTPTPTPTPTPSVTLSVTVNPSSVSGTRVGTGIVYTNTVDVDVTKGTAPYTYTFSRVSGSGSPSILVNGSDPSKAQFSRNMTGTVPETQTARFKCIVKDSKGNKGTVYIDATFMTTAQAGTGGDGTVNQPPTGGGGLPGSGGAIP